MSEIGTTVLVIDGGMAAGENAETIYLYGVAP
jgi:hypothetical protein